MDIKRSKIILTCLSTRPRIGTGEVRLANNHMLNLVSFQLNEKVISRVVVLVVVIIVILGGLFYYQNKKEETKLPPGESSSETSSENSGVTTPKVLYNLTGIIEEFGENTVYFEADIPQIDEKGQLVSKKEIRKAILEPTTEISRLYFETHRETGKKIPKEIEMDFEDLKIGNEIEVLSNQNIGELQEFKVTKVRVLSY